MALPVEPTPTLEGEEIVRFFKWMENNEKNPVPLRDINVEYTDELKQFSKKMAQSRAEILKKLGIDIVKE